MRSIIIDLQQGEIETVVNFFNTLESSSPILKLKFSGLDNERFVYGELMTNGKYDYSILNNYLYNRELNGYGLDKYMKIEINEN